MKKRVLAVLLALCMTLTLLPGMALAAEDVAAPPTDEDVADVPTEGDDAEEDTEEDTEESTEEDTEESTEEDTEESTEEDTEEPTEEDTEEPTEEDTEEPTEEDTEEPTEEDKQFGTKLTLEKYQQSPANLAYDIIDRTRIECWGSAASNVTFTVDTTQRYDIREVVDAWWFRVDVTTPAALPVKVIFPVPATIDWNDLVLLHKEDDGLWNEVVTEVVNRNSRTVSFVMTEITGEYVIAERASNDFIHVLTSDNGSVTPSARRAEAGERVSLYVSPDKGYELDTLTVTDTRGRNIIYRSLGDNAYTFIMPTTRVTVEARFKAIKGSTSVPGTTDPAEDETFNSLGTPGISGIVLNPAAMPYTDVKGPDWFYNNVEYMWKHYLMSGVSETQFAPNVTTNRGMIWTILARMNNVRTDINPGSTWYEKGMLWCKEHGITDGSNPLSDITREQLVTMLWRNSGKQGGTGDLSKFSDSADVSDYAVTAMRWAVGNGILKGENGKIDPKGTATRAQVAAMVARYGDKIVQ